MSPARKIALAVLVVFWVGLSVFERGSEDIGELL